MQQSGPWEAECQLADGARLSRLRYDGIDLLTRAPALFHPPKNDFGLYETRPVYGYDDCFPTVEKGDEWPDHGELCWLEWGGTETECSVRSRRMPVTFTRRLQFGERELTWLFSATNHGGQILPVQHVMHPLMPLAEITAIELPPCENHDSSALANRLVRSPEGSVEMLFLNNIHEGRFVLQFGQRLRLTTIFSAEMFPTIALWWNNRGYPNEDGCRRIECAFEPTPGRTSRLRDGTTMRLLPHQRLDWQVRWEVEPCH